MAPNGQVCKRLQRIFGSRLREVRKREKKGQKELGTALRLTRTSISNIERGKQRIYLDQVFEAARYLRVSIAELMPPLDEVLPVAEIHQPGDDPLTPEGREVALRMSEKFRLSEPRAQRPRTSKRR